jgi:hypothetical protein
MSHIICYTLYITHYMLHIICHTLYVTHYISINSSVLIMFIENILNQQIIDKHDGCIPNEIA